MIFHIDMDAFFAAIEVRDNPSLKGKELIVGGNPDQRGVVSTCSYEARKYGVRSGMALSEAKRLCPHAIFVSGNFQAYREASKAIMALFSAFTPFVQPMSIDEAYLDLHEKLENESDAIPLAAEIHRAVYESTQLTCSIGIASNKMVAKIASGHCKPNGLCLIPKGTEAAFLHPLAIDVIPGIGKSTSAYLKEKGFHTVGDLQKLSLEECIETFDRWGYDLHRTAQGIDERPVRYWERDPKSIGEETTFPVDTKDVGVLRETLKELVADVTARLKKKGMRARGMTLKLRDERFHTFTRSRTLFTHCQVEEIFERESLDLFETVYPKGMWVRLIGITLEKLTKEEWQPTLWNWEQDPMHPLSAPPSQP